MLNIFLNKVDLTPIKIVSPSYNFIREKLLSELFKVIRYYHQSSFTINNDHILVRLIKTIDIDYTLNDIDFIEKIDDNLNTISRYFKFSSSYSKGEWINDTYFYGDNSSLLIMSYSSTDEYFNKVIDNSLKWKLLTPVYPLDHPNLDFSFYPPDGSFKRNINTYSVVNINILSLMLMYKYFIKERGDLDDKSIRLFVKNFVLPAMLKNHIDLVLFNRLKYLLDYKEIDIDYYYKTLPFNIVDYDKKINSILRDLLDRINKSTMFYPDLLNSIPGVYNKSIYDALMLPDFPLTQQIKLDFYLTRLKTMNFLLSLNNKYIRLNKNFISNLKLFYKDIKTGKLFYKFPYEVEIELINFMNKLNGVV